MEPDLKAILEENLKLTREVHASVVKIRRHLAWQRVVSTIYFILIVGPLIVAAFILPPIIKPLWQQSQSIFESFQSPGNVSSGKLPAGLDSLNAQDVQNFLKTIPPPGGRISAPAGTQRAR